MSSDAASDEKVDKLVKRVMAFKNPFCVLGADPTTPSEEIQKRYKRMALILHPDKCKHPRAKEAFAQLKKCLETLTEAAMLPDRAAYSEMWHRAETKALDNWAAKGRKRKFDDDESLKQFRHDVELLTQKLQMEAEQAAENIEKAKQANDRYVQDKRAKILEEMRKDDEKERDWEEKRDDRVAGWRTWQDRKGNGDSKPKKKPRGLMRPPKPKDLSVV
eukprot:TRINITY_DN5228_c0_g2_i2.p1 TRINITY_DN5228_c0_g2~~TRINITY_DN5228_c0_g2_i2.p1  ORF type:complete len:218 (+),score=73.30 TRINITY_DN5228_c0_g2_i2:171-824(+)